MVLSLFMAYRSFGRFGQAGYPPRYAALLTPSSPIFPHSSPPLPVRQFVQRLQRVVVSRGEPPVDDALRHPLRFGGAEIGGLEDGAQHAFRRCRILADVI